LFRFSFPLSFGHKIEITFCDPHALHLKCSQINRWEFLTWNISSTRKLFSSFRSFHSFLTKEVRSLTHSSIRQQIAKSIEHQNNHQKTAIVFTLHFLNNGSYACNILNDKALKVLLNKLECRKSFLYVIINIR